MRFPPFDDEEPPPDYGDKVLDTEPLEVIQLDMDGEEDAAIIDWFYDPKPLVDTLPILAAPVAVMANVYPLGRTLLSDHTDIDARSSQRKRSTWLYLAAQSLGHSTGMWTLSTRIGTSSTTLTRPSSASRSAPSTKSPSPTSITLPRSVEISPYHTPKNAYIRTEDPNLSAFFFDAIINPIFLRAAVPKNAPLVSHEDTILRTKWWRR